MNQELILRDIANRSFLGGDTRNSFVIQKRTRYPSNTVARPESAPPSNATRAKDLLKLDGQGSSRQASASSASLSLNRSMQRDPSPYVEKFNTLAAQHGLSLISACTEHAVKPGPKQEQPPPRQAKRGIWKRLVRSNSTAGDSQHRSVVKKSSVGSLLGQEPKLSLNSLSLDEFFQLGGISIVRLPQEYRAVQLLIPTCLAATANHMIENGRDAGGIFRIPGQSSIVQSIYNHYLEHFHETESSRDNVHFSLGSSTLPPEIDCSIHDVASTFKKFLWDLPGGILGSVALFHALQEIEDRDDCAKLQPQLCALAILSLTSSRRIAIICSVLGLLAYLRQDPSDSIQETPSSRISTAETMSSKALGVVFAPVFLGDLTNHIVLPNRSLTPGEQDDPGPQTPRKMVLGLEKSSNHRKSVSIEKGPAVVIDKIARPQKTSEIALGLERANAAATIIQMLLTRWEEIAAQMRAFDRRLGSERSSKSYVDLYSKGSGVHTFFDGPGEECSETQQERPGSFAKRFNRSSSDYFHQRASRIQHTTSGSEPSTTSGASETGSWLGSLLFEKPRSLNQNMGQNQRSKQHENKQDDYETDQVLEEVGMLTLEEMISSFSSSAASSVSDVQDTTASLSGKLEDKSKVDAQKPTPKASSRQTSSQGGVSLAEPEKNPPASRSDARLAVGCQITPCINVSDYTDEDLGDPYVDGSSASRSTSVQSSASPGTDLSSMLLAPRLRLASGTRSVSEISLRGSNDRGVTRVRSQRNLKHKTYVSTRREREPRRKILVPNSGKKKQTVRTPLSAPLSKHQAEQTFVSNATATQSAPTDRSPTMIPQPANSNFLPSRPAQGEISPLKRRTTNENLRFERRQTSTNRMHPLHTFDISTMQNASLQASRSTMPGPLYGQAVEMPVSQSLQPLRAKESFDGARRKLDFRPLRHPQASAVGGRIPDDVTSRREQQQAQRTTATVSILHAELRELQEKLAMVRTERDEWRARACWAEDQIVASLRNTHSGR